MKNIVLVFLACSILGCVGKPNGVEPVSGFDLEQYLGRWYEIARLDHSFERGLSKVTAEYSMREDGGVSVLNRGYSVEKDEWTEADGKAYFVEDINTGFLKVSFFGPFYGSYIVFEFDEIGYEYAFVSGPSTKYLWLLSRKPTIDQDLKDRFVQRATELGFKTEELIFVDH